MSEIIACAVEGRLAPIGKALMKAITETVVKNFGVPPGRVVVQIVEATHDRKPGAAFLLSET